MSSVGNSYAHQSPETLAMYSPPSNRDVWSNVSEAGLLRQFNVSLTAYICSERTVCPWDATLFRKRSIVRVKCSEIGGWIYLETEHQHRRPSTPKSPSSCINAVFTFPFTGGVVPAGRTSVSLLQSHSALGTFIESSSVLAFIDDLRYGLEMEEVMTVITLVLLSPKAFLEWLVSFYRADASVV